MKVSVILPTFNESGNIVPLIREILKNLDGYEAEVVVADDNSPDHTCELVKHEFAGDPRVKTVLRLADPGLANSIRAGIEASTGDQLVVMDSDWTHDPVEIPRLLYISKYYDIVSGSRFAPGGNMQDRPHYFSSFFYNFALRLILRTQVQDNLGGYFTIGRDNLRMLNADQIFSGYGEYFFRLLHQAQGKGFRIVEIPAQYIVRKQGSSKSNFLKLLFQYSIAAFELRLEKSLPALADTRETPRAATPLRPGQLHP
jgi:dolichol-phosphate mannosyltransferase